MKISLILAEVDKDNKTCEGVNAKLRIDADSYLHDLTPIVTCTKF